MQFNHSYFKEVSERLSISTTEKMVLHSLVSHTDWNEDSDNWAKCWPSHRTLAGICSVSCRTVQRALNKLRELGLVTWKQSYQKQGGQTSNVYELCLTDENLDRVAKFLETRTKQPQFKQENKVHKQPLIEKDETETPAFNEPEKPSALQNVAVESKSIEVKRVEVKQADNRPKPPPELEGILDWEWMIDDPTPEELTYDSVSGQYPEWSEADKWQLVCSIMDYEKRENGYYPTSKGKMWPKKDFLLPDSMLPVLAEDYGDLAVTNAIVLGGQTNDAIVDSSSAYWATPYVYSQAHLEIGLQPNPALNEWKHIRFERMPLTTLTDERDSKAGVWAYRKVDADCVVNGKYVSPKYGPMDKERIKRLIIDSMVGEAPVDDDVKERKKAHSLIKTWFMEFYRTEFGSDYQFQGGKDAGQLRNLVGYLFNTLDSQGIEPSADRALELFKRIMDNGLGDRWKRDLLTLSTIAGQYNHYLKGAISSYEMDVDLNVRAAMEAFEYTHDIQKRRRSRCMYRKKSEYTTYFDANELHFFEIQFLREVGLPPDYFYDAPYFHPYVHAQFADYYSPELAAKIEPDKPWK